MPNSFPHSLKKTLETILVVDDHAAVLKTVVAILEHANFRVLSANCCASAIKLAAETDEKIDLLLSDLDMQQMLGPDVGETLKKTRPDMHVMLMSGVQKPFVPVKLIQMVTDVLRSRQDRRDDGDAGYTESLTDRCGLGQTLTRPK